MLKQIEIQNFILIDSLSLAVAPGLTVMTGETGAGKSILLGALSAALGKRINAKNILKDSSKKSIIEITVEVDVALKEAFLSYDVDYDRDTVFRRELLPSGKSRCFINDTPVKASVLSALAGLFIDVNSQNDEGLLNRTDQQLELIDAFAQLKKEKTQYQKEYTSFLEAQNKIVALDGLGSAADLDYLTFVKKELNAVVINVQQYQEIESQLESARSARNQQELFSEVSSSISKNSGVMDGLFTLESALTSLAMADERFESDVEELNLIIGNIQNLQRKVKLNMDSTMSDNEYNELDATRKRIDALVRKYRVSSIEELLHKKDSVEQQVDRLLNRETELARLKDEQILRSSTLAAYGEELHQKRIQATRIIEDAFKDYLDRVDLPKAKMKLDWSPTGPKTHGTYKPLFLFAANPGSSMEPLHKVASGGEQSRVKLALKAVLGLHASLSTQVFDEIDTGISGSTAEKVGTLMRELSKKQQIIAITHLPQVASKASVHWKVSKHQQADTTYSTVHVLNKKERTQEIARILSGEQVTAAAKKQAESLLNDH
tara:strand:+ start:1105 stop:2748 length:1644 start_codon:yes stop_codon:yes gene_type:complete